MAVIGRLCTIAFAYLSACLAASIVLAVGTIAPRWDEWASLGLPSALVWPAIGVGAVLIAAVAMLPALLVLLLAESFGWRSVLIYGALGGALGLALCYGIDFAGHVGVPDSLLAQERQVLAAAGICGGLVYWLFAGRNAGSWK